MTDHDAASDESEFWRKRRELTPQPITEQDVEKRGVGRTRHLVLLAHISDPAVISGLSPVLDRLDEFECFESIQVRNLHITIKVLGNIVEDPSGEREYSREGERHLATAFSSALDKIPSFSITFPRLNLFPAVVYGEVDDGGHFIEANRAICDLPEVSVWERDRDGFVPHLTLGHFTQSDGYEEVVAYLEENRSLSVPSMTIDELGLMAFDFTEGRFPAPEVVKRYELGPS